MWASKLNPWNVKDMGPHRDTMAELEEAIRARGMKFVTTFHHARNNQHMINKDGKLVWTGHYPRVAGWPTVSDDPKLRILYGNLPRHQFLDLWKGELFEVIDHYHPDLMWFDSWLDEIPETYQTEYLAHYFNKAREWHKDVVVTCKQRDLPLDIAVEDFEKGRADKLLPLPWLTDDTISTGSWCYVKGLRIKPAGEVLHDLIDIVSKNGQLLLNISPKADGTIPQNQQDVLLAIGGWLGKYGEAIYKTRPFLVYGEGPTHLKRGGHFVKEVHYGAKDIRYTRNGDTVYAIVLGWPGAGETVTLGAFGKNGAARDIQVDGITLLGSREAVAYKQTRKGLALTCPSQEPDTMAVVFKLATQGLPPMG